VRITEAQLESIADDLEKGSKYRVAFELMNIIATERSEKVLDHYGSREYILELYDECLKVVSRYD
jgi:hypothetical protein